MIWLALASLGLAAKIGKEEKKNTYLWLSGTSVFYGSLIAWLWLEAGAQAFRGSETGLIGWFIIGSVLFMLGELLPILVSKTGGWTFATTALGAFCLGLGLDVFRPDDYSYVPGAILGVLVLIVAVQAFLSLRVKFASTRFIKLFFLAAYIFAIAFLVYAATAKMIDRGWAFPWAYLASAGAFLFAASQIWMGWGRIQKKLVVAPWLQIVALNSGHLLMVVAAYFVYREFL